MKFTDRSLPLIDLALEVSDVYRLDNLSYKIASHDVGTAFDNRVDEIRTKWMFGKSGLYNGIVDNKYAMSRILQYYFIQDFNKSFRQRQNIVQEMLKVDFKSNVPVHITISPKLYDGEREHILDFDNPDTFDNFLVIIHPGQTRAQASVFCKRNLDNVLLYIPKYYHKYVTIKNFPKHTKITDADSLSKSYSPFKNPRQKDYVIDLVFKAKGDDIDQNLKFHKHRVPNYEHRTHKVYILKACQITVDGKEEHPSHYYIEQSFISFNKFCQTLHRNDYSLYTTLSTPQAKNLFWKNTSKIFSVTLNDKKLVAKKMLNIMESTDGPTPATGVWCSSAMVNSFEDDKVKSFIKGLQRVYDMHREVLDYEERNDIKDSPCTIHYPVFEKSQEFDYKKIAKEQDYKGYAVWYNPKEGNNIYRDFYELLYFISDSTSCTISENKELAIINCEHEYWKTGKNYVEWTLTQSMYND